MKITYVSDYLTLHLRAFAQDMYRMLGTDFHFVETVSAKSVSKENSFRTGYAYFQASDMADEVISWRLQAFKSYEEKKKCIDLIFEINNSWNWVDDCSPSFFIYDVLQCHRLLIHLLFNIHLLYNLYYV